MTACNWQWENCSASVSQYLTLSFQSWRFLQFVYTVHLVLRAHFISLGTSMSDAWIKFLEDCWKSSFNSFSTIITDQLANKRQFLVESDNVSVAGPSDIFLVSTAQTLSKVLYVLELMSISKPLISLIVNRLSHSFEYGYFLEPSSRVLIKSKRRAQ